MRDSNRQRSNSRKSSNSINQSSPTIGTKRAGRDKGKGPKNKNGKGLVEKRERDLERETRTRKDVSKLEVRKSNFLSKERKRQASHGDKDSGPSGPRAKKKERLVEAACTDMSDRKNAESSIPLENADSLGQGGAREDGAGVQRERKDRKERKERRDRKERKERKEDSSRASRGDRALDDDRAALGQPSMESILRSLVQQGHPGSFGGPELFFSHPFHSGSSSHQREKINSLIDLIENDGNPGEQLTGLSELCEHVSISSEDSMLSFPTDRVVPLLIGALQGSENPDVMLLAARAMTLLLDVYPPSARFISQCGGLEIFYEKLLSIEYIDLAEQSIQALGKMSESYPALLLDPHHGNVLDAVLSFVDFFQIGMQRIAVGTAANVCRAMASGDEHWRSSTLSGGDGAEYGMLDGIKAICQGSTPTLLQLTTSSDNKIALSAYQALTSIAKACSVSGLPVESVIDVDSLQVVIERLAGVGGAVQMKPCVFYAMVRFMSESTSTSVELPKRLLEKQVPCVVSNILALLSTKAQATSVGNSAVGMLLLPELKPRDQEEANALISLMDNMLPPVLGSDLRVFDRSKTKREMKTLERVGVVVRNENAMLANRKKNLVSIREELLGEGGRAAVDAVAPMLLDPLLHLEFATLSRDSKMGVLSLVDKILFYSSPACLTKLMSELPLSVFIIRLLQSSNHEWPLSSLKFIASMLQKQPELKKSLLREGILHEVKKTKDTFLGLGEAEKDVSSAYAWLADRVLIFSFGEHPKNTSGSKGEGNETEGMVALKKLRVHIAASTDDDGRALHGIGSFLKLVLERAVSPYEIHASGILEDVYRYLHSGDAHDVASASRRRTSFWGLLESPEATERVIDTIQDVLMNSEHLQVINSMTQAVPSLRSMLIGNAGPGARNDGREMDPFANGLRALGTPLRIKLRCTEDVLKDRLSGTAILIEPLATVAQTQEYLRPKITRVLTSKIMDKLKTSRGQAPDGVAGESIVTRSKSKRLGYLAGMGKSVDASEGRQHLDQVYQSFSRSPARDRAHDEDEEDMEMLDELSDGEGGEDIDMVGGEDINIDLDESSSGDGGNGGRHNGHANPQDGRRLRSTVQVDATAGAAGERDGFCIRLFLHGKELDSTDTLLRVIHSEKLKESRQNSLLDMAHVWKETHQIDFSIDPMARVDSMTPSDSTAASIDCDSKLEDILCNGKDPRISGSLVDRQVYYAVYVLKVFEDASRELRPLLINSKICSKLTKQMRDPLLVCSRMLPGWCSRLPRVAKFLFSYEARRMYFRYHAFGLGRTMMAMLEDASWHGSSGDGQGPGSELPFRTPRVVRQKVRISRYHVLESSKKVFDRYADSKSRLEVEFYNEAGSGLGPTLEFYTLLSAEFLRRDLGMWRESELPAVALTEDADENLGIMEDRPGPRAGELPVNKRSKKLVMCPLGLFPKPISAGQDGNTVTTALLDNFRLLGQAAAKAIQDSRLLDIPLSRPFYKAALYGPGSLERSDLKDIDPVVFKTLSQIEHAILDAQGSSSPKVLLSGIPIDDLCLSFVLPGDDAFDLCPGGINTTVTSQNASRYVDCVYAALLDTGIRAQMTAFRQGFNRIFPLEHLEIFYEDEIEDILCGDSNEAWTPESLTAAIKCDHGYSSSSPPVVALINVLSDLDPTDKRRFLKFVTGAPRLPAGGFSSLKPKLTVVRKNPDIPKEATGNHAGAEWTGEGPMSPRTRDQLIAVYADRDLPSVMTCANYLKLPPYSTVDVLRNRLLFSIREGQNSFDLS